MKQRRKHHAARTASGHAGRVLSAAACTAIVERSGWGHLTFTRQLNVEVVPIRLVYVEGWLYFRANTVLRAAIARNPWVVVSIGERVDPTLTASVVARGTCYATEETGSHSEDAAALRGILQLRTAVPAGVERQSRSQRTAIVFRMHVDHLRGRTLDHGRAAAAGPHVHLRSRALPG